MRSYVLLLFPTIALAQPPQPVSHRTGMTFETNLGIGYFWSEYDVTTIAGSTHQRSTREVALGGLNVGIGGWVNERMAISLRIAGATYTNTVGDFDPAKLDVRVTSGVLGPHLQYWLDDHLWIGGGAGVGFALVTIEGANVEQNDREVGPGLDMRAGYTFSTSSENTFNVSVEFTPSFITMHEVEYTFIGGAILFGYQHL